MGRLGARRRRSAGRAFDRNGRTGGKGRERRESVRHDRQHARQEDIGVNREEQNGDRKTIEQPRVLARVERIDGLQEKMRVNRQR